ncbi:unnamed protein product [Acanthosepion pharaonis]|uniref:Uncharacterized protein n=1 Tax=Acanthosepion pharaonis TaxID=158019 RepID=A0A812DN20_ACAPH|nr:unnamed protein product [Sepia pharaonis]
MVDGGYPTKNYNKSRLTPQSSPKRVRISPTTQIVDDGPSGKERIVPTIITSSEETPKSTMRVTAVAVPSGSQPPMTSAAGPPKPDHPQATGYADYEPVTGRVETARNIVPPVSSSQPKMQQPTPETVTGLTDANASKVTVGAQYKPVHVETFSINSARGTAPYTSTPIPSGPSHTQGTSASSNEQTTTTVIGTQQTTPALVEDDDYDEADNMPVMGTYPRRQWLQDLDNPPEPTPLQYPSAKRPMTFRNTSSSKVSIYDNVSLPYIDSQ